MSHDNEYLKSDDLYKKIKEIYENEKKCKLLNNSSKYIDYAHAIHLSFTDNTYADIINLLHESIHALLDESSFSWYLGDLVALYDFFISASDIWKHPLCLEYENFLLSLLDLSKRSFSQREQNFIYFIDSINTVYSKYLDLKSKSRLVQEGVATYCSLNINNHFYENSFFSYFFSFFPELDFEELKMEQKKQKEKILSLKKGAYYDGYKIAEEFAKRYGIEAVITSAMIALNTPYYTDDLLGCPYEKYKELSESLYNPNLRWKKIIKLPYQDVFNKNATLNDVHNAIVYLEDGERKKRKCDFVSYSMYSLQYLFLNNYTLFTLEWLFGYDLSDFLYQMCKGNLKIGKNEIDNFFERKCLYNCDPLLQKNNDFLLEASQCIINPNNRHGKKFITQLNDDIISGIIERQKHVDFNYYTQQNIYNRIGEIL